MPNFTFLSQFAVWFLAEPNYYGALTFHLHYCRTALIVYYCIILYRYCRWGQLPFTSVWVA